MKRYLNNGAIKQYSKNDSDLLQRKVATIEGGFSFVEDPKQNNWIDPRKQQAYDFMNDIVLSFDSLIIFLLFLTGNVVLFGMACIMMITIKEMEK